MNNLLLEDYIRSIILEEKEVKKTKKIISEIILHNDYRNYNKLDETTKLRIKNILQKAIIYGVASASLIAGLGAAGMGPSQGLGPAKEIIQTLSQPGEEAIKTSVNILTQGNFAANKKLSKNVLKQLAIIMSNRDGDDSSSFIIVDDMNHILHHFTNEGVVDYTTPVITGRDLDENKLTSINFTNWLAKTGNLSKYKSVANSKDRKSKKIKNNLFNGYLSYVSKNKQKITEQGVYSISAIKKVGKKGYTQDSVAYGRLGKISIKQGIDAPISGGVGIAIHGTGIKGRKIALSRAIELQKRADELHKKADKYFNKKRFKVEKRLRKKADKLSAKASHILDAVNSYGCINVQDRQLKTLMNKVSEYDNTTVYVMADSGDGVVNFGGSLWENSWAAANFFFKAFEGLGVKAYAKFRDLVGSKPQLKYNNKKFKLK